MKAIRIVFFLLVLPLLLSQVSTPCIVATTVSVGIQFSIKAIAENGNHSELLAHIVIDGPQDSDFDIDLQDRHFKLQAAFITDLLDREQLQVRVKILTKRRVGYSARQLPLYEEDEQQHKFLVAADEAMELLPFGRNNEGEVLKVKIEPLILSTPHKVAPLKIDIVKPPQNGFINVKAHKSPHKFKVDAQLLMNGVMVARGMGNCLLQDVKELPLQPVEGKNLSPLELPLVLSFKIDEYLQHCNSGTFIFHFDLYGTQNSDRVQKNILVKNWNGAGSLGERLISPLDEAIPPTNGKYQLVFNVNLAE